MKIPLFFLPRYLTWDAAFRRQFLDLRRFRIRRVLVCNEPHRTVCNSGSVSMGMQHKSRKSNKFLSIQGQLITRIFGSSFSERSVQRGGPTPSDRDHAHTLLAQINVNRWGLRDTLNTLSPNHGRDDPLWDSEAHALCLWQLFPYAAAFQKNQLLNKMSLPFVTLSETTDLGSWPYILPGFSLKGWQQEPGKSNLDHFTF